MHFHMHSPIMSIQRKRKHVERLRVSNVFFNKAPVHPQSISFVDVRDVNPKTDNEPLTVATEEAFLM